MEYRLNKTIGYLFLVFGLFFFIKNLPFLWYLNSVPHSNHLNGLSLQEELFFWGKFFLSFSVSVIFPILLGTHILTSKQSNF
jgi:hypothetical protein